MPELPEVQTIISDLQILIGDQITDFFSDFPKALKNISTANFAKEITDQKIKKVSRLGKIILIQLSPEKNIAIHLKMTGKLILVERLKSKVKSKEIQETTSKHLHHIFYLKKHGSLEFHDVRKFATISLLNKKDITEIKNKYGVDPIDDFFSSETLASLLDKRKNKAVKSVLMDNSVILGIGNIYASEILFAARLLPSRPVSSLTKSEIEKLHGSIKKILSLAIKLRGTSVSDYRDAKGKIGAFQNELMVYRRYGQECKKCDTLISRSVIGQRSTFYCSHCQH